VVVSRGGAAGHRDDAVVSDAVKHAPAVIATSAPMRPSTLTAADPFVATRRI